MTTLSAGGVKTKMPALNLSRRVSLAGEGAWRKLPPYAAALGLYALLSLIYLRPIWRLYFDHVTPDPDDPVFNLYVLKWVVHQVHLGFPHLWDANFFYPTRGVLAFSDHLLGPAFEIALIPNAIVGYNALFFTSFVACGLVTCFVLHRSGCSWPAAFLGGAMFAFSPYRMSQINHLQILLAQWIPVTLWSFDRLLAKTTGRRAALFLVFYSLNLTSGCYLAYMIHVALLAILLSRWRMSGKGLLASASLKILLPAAILAMAAAFGVFFPYLRVAHRLDLSHDPQEVIENGAALASFLSPAPISLYSVAPAKKHWNSARLAGWKRPFLRSENALFPGFLATLFSLFGFTSSWRRHQRSPAAARRLWRRLALASLLALGLFTYSVGDAYTLRLDRTDLFSWLPEAQPLTWNMLGAAFVGSLSLWLALRRRWGYDRFFRWEDMDPRGKGLALSAIGCFLLSHPIVYVPLMRIVPGLANMRVPARFGILVSLSVAFFAARGLDQFLRRIPRPLWRGLAWTALFLLLSAELAPRPLHWVPILREEQFPAVDRWLATRHDVRALIELPIGHRTELTYMYHSTVHWKPIANGCSSFIPQSYAALAQRMQSLPDRQGLEYLERLGITHIVVHIRDLGGRWRRKYDARPIEEWGRQLGPRLALEHTSGFDRVYRIKPSRQLPLLLEPAASVPPPTLSPSRRMPRPQRGKARPLSRRPRAAAAERGGSRPAGRA